MATFSKPTLRDLTQPLCMALDLPSISPKAAKSWSWGNSTEDEAIIRVYEFTGGTWVARSNRSAVRPSRWRYGLGRLCYISRSESDATGHIITVGAPRVIGASGYIKVFRYIGGTLTELTTLFGDTAVTQFGFSVALSDPGKVLAGGDNYGGLDVMVAENTGQVKTYVMNELGTDYNFFAALNGEAAEDYSGTDVQYHCLWKALDWQSAGSVQSSFLVDGSISNRKGRFRVFQRFHAASSPTGADVAMVAHYECAPLKGRMPTTIWKLRLTQGDIVAGTYMRSTSNSETDLVYSSYILLATTCTINHNIHAHLPSTFGAPFDNGNGFFSGHVRVYQLVSANWVQIGSDIEGEGENNFVGASVALTKSGLTLAVGEPFRVTVSLGGGASPPPNVDSGDVRIYTFNGQDWSPVRISRSQPDGIAGDASDVVLPWDSPWPGRQWAGSGLRSDGVSHLFANSPRTTSGRRATICYWPSWRSLARSLATDSCDETAWSGFHVDRGTA